MNGRICAAATAKTMPELRAMVKNAERARADLVEVRLDYLNEDCDLREIRDLTALPIIATNRLIEEGGLFEGTEEKRVSVLVDAASNGFDFVDVELMAKNVEGIIKRLRKTDVKILVSLHRSSSTPNLQELNRVFKKELAVGADVCKIIITAEKVEDNLTCLRFVSEASKVKDVICFCMGRLGTPSRLLSPLFGGFFTYASIEMGKESAPGQLTIAETRKFYELM